MLLGSQNKSFLHLNVFKSVLIGVAHQNDELTLQQLTYGGAAGK